MKDRDKLIILLSSIGSLVCLNLLSLEHFWRLDLTEAGVYTLSDASRATMKELEDPVTVTAYFSENLPPPFSQNSQFVQDLLEEYRAAGGGALSYEFIDPEKAETIEDKAIKKDVKVDVFGRRMRERTSIEQELESLGIAPVEIRVIEEDEAKTKRAYMGLVVRYGEETEAIPVVQQTADLEYNLTTLIRNLTRTRVPVLGVVSGHGELSLEEDATQLKMLLEQTYEVRTLELQQHLSEKGQIDDDFDALLVLSPKQAFSDEEQRALDAFLMKGKSAAFFLDQVNVDLRTNQVQPTAHGLGALLAKYGVELGSQLVADVSSASLSVNRRMGNMTVQMPLQYPFVPVVQRFEGDTPLTRGLAEVTLPFATPVYLADELKEQGGAREGRVLARSSERSWLEDGSLPNLAPQRFLERVEASFTGPYDLMASVEGELPSAFGQEPEGAKDDKATSRLLVIGSGGFVRDDFLAAPNAALAMNAVDWLLLDPALLGMRTRGLIDAPLEPELSEGVRHLVKYGNAVGVPLLLLFYGFLRWRRRESRRRRLGHQPA